MNYGSSYKNDADIAACSFLKKRESIFFPLFLSQTATMSSPARLHFPARWPVVAPPRRNLKLRRFKNCLRF
jgi:hypothetical protein